MVFIVLFESKEGNCLTDFSNIGWDEGIETKLLNWNTELGKFSFVGLDHVGVSFSDLLELRLNLANCLVLQLLDLLERTTDHTESLWVDSSRRQDLVGLSILRFKALLDRLELLLQDEVTETCLTMDVVDNAMELLEELLLLLLDVLELLVTNFILPLNLLVLLLRLNDLLLLVC